MRQMRNQKTTSGTGLDRVAVACAGYPAEAAGTWFLGHSQLVGRGANPGGAAPFA